MIERWLCTLLVLIPLTGCDGDNNGDSLPDIDVGDVAVTDFGNGGDDAADLDGIADVSPDVSPDAADLEDVGGDMAGPLPGLTLQPVASGLTSPIAMALPNDGSQRTFIVDQVGLIRVLDAQFNLVAEPFADLQDRLVTLMEDFDERGLLGLAFHPDFANNGRLFVYYSAPLRGGAPADFDHTNVVSEFTVDGTGAFDPTSERILLEIDHPYFNHNGGTLAFGEDGFLYLSIGDGGNRDDVGIGHTEGIGNAQDITNLHGNILRLDVDSGDPYGIPADNPFVGQEGADEIFAYGLRNPYRFSFDRESGRLFVGDAGQDLMEEISIVENGGNYGWNTKEGTLCFNVDDATDPPEACANVGANGEPLADPILTFARPLSAFESPSQEVMDIVAASEVVGLVVVGGHVYRGTAAPAYDGRYIFGSWSSSFTAPQGAIFVGTEQGASSDLEPATVDDSADGMIDHFVLAFGQDVAGEVYVLTSDNVGPSGTTGQVFRLAPQ